MSKIKASENDRWSLLKLVLGYLWLVKSLSCSLAFDSHVPFGGVHFSELGSMVLLLLPRLISFAFHSSIRS